MRHPHLLLRFALYAAVALLAALVIGAWLARSQATKRAERDAHAHAIFVADELGRDDLARTALARPVRGQTLPLLDDLFSREARGHGVRRASLIDRRATVTYSTDHALIGRRSDADKVRAALLGRRVQGVTRDKTGSELLETYVPVRWALAEDDRPAGVLAVYREYGPVAVAIRDEFLLQAATIAFALGVLYLALFPILRRVTANLAASEARYRALMEQGSDAIFVCDGDGTVLEPNEQACALLGRRREEIVGRSFGELVDPADLARTPLRLPELHEGKNVLHERVLLHADRGNLIGELHAKKLADGRIIASVRDVTDRRRADEAVRRLASIVESSHDAIIGEDRDGTILSWNRSAERVYGYLAEEVLGNPITMLVPKELPGDPDAILERLRPGKRLEEFETVHVDKDGRELDVALTISPVRNSAGEIVGASTIVRDITAEKQRELAWREQLGTPRAGGGTAELDLGAAFEAVEQRLRPLLDDRIALVKDFESGLPTVEADPEQIEQAIVNLVLNARNAMPDGGTLTVATKTVDFQRRRRPPSPDVRVEPGMYAMLAVSDTGAHWAGDAPGLMDAEERIGLGLAAVFAIARRRGGTIGVESEPARGTTVRLYLPAARSSVPAPQNSDAARNIA